MAYNYTIVWYWTWNLLPSSQCFNCFLGTLSLKTSKNKQLLLLTWCRTPIPSPPNLSHYIFHLQYNTTLLIQKSNYTIISLSPFKEKSFSLTITGAGAAEVLHFWIISLTVNPQHPVTFISSSDDMHNTSWNKKLFDFHTKAVLEQRPIVTNYDDDKFYLSMIKIENNIYDAI